VAAAEDLLLRWRGCMLTGAGFWGGVTRGLEAVAAAEDLLLSGRSVGKIVVQLSAEPPLGARGSPAARL
jgi:hypothetical protein